MLRTNSASGPASPTRPQQPGTRDTEETESFEDSSDDPIEQAWSCMADFSKSAAQREAAAMFAATYLALPGAPLAPAQCLDCVNQVKAARAAVAALHAARCLQRGVGAEIGDDLAKMKEAMDEMMQTAAVCPQDERSRELLVMLGLLQQWALSLVNRMR